jgi:large subunit ribosomal protein L4
MKMKVQTLGDSGSAKGGGDIDLNDDVFGLEPRADILHRVVTWQREKARGTARATRERSDVARTGKKFGNQKGGGTARHGNRRAPIFIGGGKAHGARLRDFNPSLNKKVRALGLKMALSSKAKAGTLFVLDNLDLKDAKTQALQGQIGKLGLGRKILVIDGADIPGGVNDNFRKASANLVGINVLPAVGANVYDILNADSLVLTRAAVEKLEARFALAGGAS